MNKKPDVFTENQTEAPFLKMVPAFLHLNKKTVVFTYKIDDSSGYFLEKCLFKAPDVLNDRTRPKWAAGAAYNTGDIILPSAIWQAANPEFQTAYIQTAAAGNAGAAEPVFPRNIGGTIADNGILWKAIDAFSIYCPKLRLEFIDQAGNILRQTASTDAAQIGTPAQDNARLVPALSPVDTRMQGLSWSCQTAKTTAAKLQFRYDTGDIIKIEITGQEEITLSDGSKIYAPDYCQLFLIGYYAPANTLNG